ncbi:unnamed protein product, partial [Prorocentrum cordatum]
GVAEAPNVPAQGMKCLGLWLENADHTNDKLEEVWNPAKTKEKAVVPGKPDVQGDLSRDPVGPTSLFDLPIKQWIYKPRQYIRDAVDVITDTAGLDAVAWDDVKKIMAEGRYKDLPPPLGYNDTEDALPCTLNIMICKHPSQPGSHVIAKHFSFLGNGHTMCTVKEKLIQGDPCTIDYKPDTFNSLRTFQLMVERLGGPLFRYWRFERKGSLSVPLGDGDVVQEKKEFADAMQHVKDEAPRTNWDGEQLLWAEQEYVDPASTLQHVKKEFVCKVLQILKDRDHFAAKETHYPLLKGDIRPEYQPVVDKIISTLLGNTVLLIGEAKFGKTPLVYIMAMALARYHAVGETWAPCVFDDGDLADQRPRVLKALFDPTQVESNVYVRWGAAKFKRNQARFGGDNEYDAAAEPTPTDWAFAATARDKETRTTSYLVEMAKPAFPKNLSPSNIGAMLKRCNILLNTTQNVYFRPAGTLAFVEKLPLKDGYITPEAGTCLQNFLRNNVRRNQEDFDNLLAFEKRDMLKLMREAKAQYNQGGAEPAEEPAAEPAAVSPQPAAPPNPDGEELGLGSTFQEGEDVFGHGGGMDAAPEAMPATPPTKPVKAEPGVWRRKLSSGGGLINLCSPSPKKARVDAKKSREQEKAKLDGLISQFSDGVASGAASSS